MEQGTLSRASLSLAGLVVTALLVSGCGEVNKADSNASPPESKASVEVDDLDPEAEDTPTEEEEATPDEAVPTLGKFGGDAYAYEDGLSVSVSRPKVYQPDMESCACGKGDKNFVLFTITIDNQTGQVYDPSQMYITGTTGERESEEAYDGDIGGSPSSKILPGRKTTFKNVWGVDKGKPFTMQIEPGYTPDEMTEYDSAIFTP